MISAVLVMSQATQGQQENAVEVDSIEDSELPKSVVVTEAVKFRLVGQSGSAGMVGLPKGATVEVTGRNGSMLQIVFVKSAGQIDILKTTALEEVAKTRAANERAAQERQEQIRARRMAAYARQEAERAAKRDILVHSWLCHKTAGGNYYEAVGEIENESDRVLENVQVEVTMRDAYDNILSTETAIASDRNLRPGQRTTFKVMLRSAGDGKKCSLAFRKFWGDDYTYREK